MKNDHSQTFSGYFFLSRLRLNAKLPSLIRRSFAFLCLPEAAATETGVTVAWSHNVVVVDVDTDVSCLFSCEATQPPSDRASSSVSFDVDATANRGGNPGQENSTFFLSFTWKRHKRWLLKRTSTSVSYSFAFLHRNFHWLRVWFIKSSINEIHQFLLHC